MVLVAAAPPLPRSLCNRPLILQPLFRPCATKCIPFRPPQRIVGGRWFWPSSFKRSISSPPQSAERPFQGVNTDEADHVEKEPDLPVPSSDSKETYSKWPGKGRTNEVFEKLKRYGIAGVLSYGLLNTAYYLVTFLVVWFYVAPAPARLGYAASVERFFKIMAMVWAGSQVTKLIRAGGALALAPIVDNGLSWFTVKFKFESKAKASGAIVGFCCGLAVLVFVVLTLLCA